MKKYKQYLMPSILTSLALALNEFVDCMLVSNLLGGDALAVANLGCPVILLIAAFSVLFGAGGSILYAILLGKWDRSTAGRVFRIALILAAVTGVLFFGIGILLKGPVSDILCADEALRPTFQSYYRVLLYSAPVLMLTLTFVSFLPPAGAPVIATIVNIVANGVNLVMDIVYIKVFGMDVEGGPDGVLGIEFTSYSAWLKMTGDLSRFYGTMCVSVWSNSTYQVSPHPYGYYVATDAIGGTVQLEDPKACLYVASRNGLTVGGIKTTGSSRQESVGGLILVDGSGLSASAPRLTVTNSLSLASPLGVLIAGPSEGVASGKTVLNAGSFSEPDAAGDLALIRLTPECVANGGGGSLDESIVVSNALSRSWTQWRDDVDGGRTLWLVTCVSHTSQTDVKGRSSLVYPTKTEGGSDFYWDDGSCPADDASSGGKGYFSSVSMDMPGGGEIYDVPVRMLVQTALAQARTASAAGISCNDMVWLGAGLKAFSTGVADEPNRCHEDGNPYYFYKVRGSLRVPSGHDNTLLTYGSRIVCRIESEVSGGGNFVLTTIDKSSNFKNHCGYHEFTAFNTNFTGKIRATVATATASGTQTPSGYTTPNLTEHVRLFVADERNLGGRMRRYTWDALFLEQYSELFALGDVTLGDGWNRGVAIGNNGIMNVPDGATLTIMRPLNVNGNLFKVGAGTLALGGVLSFGGESMSEVPSSGANRLIVSGGYVKPLAAHSFDGLAMTFTNNAAIAIDGVTLDEELRVYGMVNEKESVSPVVLADDQEKLKVRIDFGDLQSPPNPAWQVGVLTLPHDKAVSVYRNMLIENPKPFKSWRGKLEVVPRSEGISTIVAVYGAVGTTIIFR